MTWTRLSDDFLDRPDLIEVSRSARLLYVESLVFANRHGTDGFIRRRALRRLTDSPDPETDAAELVTAGVWQTLGDEGWQVDWSDQIRADEVEAQRSLNRERKERSRRHKAGDHSMCRPSYCDRAPRDSLRDPPRDETRDSLRDSSRDPRRDGRPFPSRPGPTRPDPSRPLGREGREGKPATGTRTAPADAAPTAATPRNGSEVGDDLIPPLPLTRHTFTGDCCDLPAANLRAHYPEEPER